jgi:hypothetical protein
VSRAAPFRASAGPVLPVGLRLVALEKGGSDATSTSSGRDRRFRAQDVHLGDVFVETEPETRP